MWYWVFNTGSAPYTTCFEAYVHAEEGDGGGGSQTASPTPRPTTGSPTERPTRTPTVAGGTYAPTPSPVVSSGDDDDDDDDGVGDAYFVIVPLCYQGGTYDKDTLINGANNAYTENVVDWDVRSHDTSSDGWNATIQTFTDYSGVVTSTAYSYVSESSLLCDEIEDTFNDGGSCIVCTPGEIRLYSTDYLATGDDDDDDDDSSTITDSDNANTNLNNKFISIIVTTFIIYYFI